MYKERRRLRQFTQGINQTKIIKRRIIKLKKGNKVNIKILRVRECNQIAEKGKVIANIIETRIVTAEVTSINSKGIRKCVQDIFSEQLAIFEGKTGGSRQFWSYILSKT